MKLEANDRRFPYYVCVATIEDVRGEGREGDDGGERGKEGGERGKGGGREMMRIYF